MNKVITILILSFGLFLITSCANSDGDHKECPTCDNTTEMLVGEKCVAISEVELCGPDGHLHGEECHCFSGQSVTEIDGKKYCLQQSCHEDEEHDLDQEVCELIETIGEQVTAVATFEAFEDAHLDLEKGIELTLSRDSDGFVHFPIKESGEVALYVSEADLFESAYDKDEKPLTTTSMGANEDCSDLFKAVYHIEVTGVENSTVPGILKFKPFDGKIKVVIHPIDDEHDHE